VLQNDYTWVSHKPCNIEKADQKLIWCETPYNRDDVVKADWARQNSIDFVIMKRAMQPEDYETMKTQLFHNHPSKLLISMQT
jgi:hypothetical protein